MIKKDIQSQTLPSIHIHTHVCTQNTPMWGWLENVDGELVGSKLCLLIKPENVCVYTHTHTHTSQGAAQITMTPSYPSYPFLQESVWGA